ncbi:MAG: thioredoxin family protein [Bacteroidota bacterium]
MYQSIGRLPISKFISTLLFLLIYGVVAAQGIDFFEGTWEDALAKAEKEEKLIFVDAYTVWCGPCKRMAKTVFTAEEVGEYYNKNFINVKIDMEKEEGLTFGKAYPVSAYPTLLYIDHKGEVAKKVVGGKDVKAFVELGQLVVRSYDRSVDLAKLYEEGDRSYDLVLKYVKALNNANKPSLKISNEFLRDHQDLTSDQRASFLFEAVTTSDSRLFTQFLGHLPALIAQKGEEMVHQKIKDACWNTVEMAIQFESTDLLEEAKSNMNVSGLDSDQFDTEADYRYAKATADVELLERSALSLAKGVARQDASALHDICNEIVGYKEIDRDILNTSEKIAKMAADKGESAEYTFTYAKILAENNKTKKAVKMADKAMEMVRPGSKEAKMIEEWISEINR